MRYCLFFVAINLLTIPGLKSQSLNSILQAAENSKASKNYYDAFHKFKEALEFESENISFLYNAAEMARYLSAYKQSAILYDSVLHHEKNNIYPNTAFWLGQMRQIQGDYAKAIMAYKIFQTEHSNEDAELQAIAKKEILSCEWALEQLNNPAKGVQVTRLDDKINSPYSDFAPVLINHQLFYSSLRFENPRIETLPKRFVSALLKSDNYSTPTRLLQDTFVSPGLNLAYTSFDKKKSKVCYTICEDINDTEKRCDLYISQVDGKQNWSKGIKLPNPVNLDQFSNTHPNLAYDETRGMEILYFVSDRPGGKGAYDIWFTYIDSSGNYSEPLNLTELNTVQNDVSPYYSEKSQTLYYSSQGQLGMGGYDVYSSKRLNNRWSTPKNLGVPVNSSFDDLYYSLSDQDTLAFFSSNRTGTLYLDDAAEACCYDIFKVKLESCDIRLDAFVYNYYTKADLLGATVTLIDLEQPQSEPVTITDQLSNKFNFSIRCEKNYKVIATKPGYTSDTIIMSTGTPGEFPHITKKLFLKPTAAKLDVFTFNKNSGAPLSGVTITLIDLDDTSKGPIIVTNDSSNFFHFHVDPCHKYELAASKEDFAPAGTNFIIDCGLDGTLTQNLYLPTILFSFLPVSLYFDNDRPDPSTLNLTTRKSYFTIFQSYYNQKKTFLLNYSKIHGPVEDSLSDDMEEFFENEVLYNKEKFSKFLSVLESDLKKGKVYEIFVKGYASPLAKSDYNFNLSQRRIVSIYNEFYKYRKGVFKKYIKNGQLKLSQKPFGETTAPAGISDDKKDLRSVFSVSASRERRVEIIEIKE